MRGLIKQTIFLGLLFWTACRTFGPAPEAPPIDWAFYRDEIEVESFIVETDPPARKAAFRMISQSRKKEGPTRKDTLPDLEKALNLDPSNPYTYYYLSLAHLERSHPRDALVMAKRSEQLFNGYPLWQGKALVLQARAYEQLSEPAKARVYYERTLEVDPQNPQARQAVRSTPPQSG